MLTKFSDIKISLGRAIFINVAILGIAFYSGIFYSNQASLRKAIEAVADDLKVLETRVEKKIGIQNKQGEEIDQNENKVIGLEKDVEYLKEKHDD